jgi:hypothetical protein
MVRSYAQVAKAPGPGSAYYEARDQFAAKMAEGFELDVDDVANLRLIYSNPDLKVIGPNMIPPDVA